MVVDVTVGEDTTVDEISGTDAYPLGGGGAGGHRERAYDSILQANARTAVKSNTIAVAETWTEIDVNGDSSGNAVIDVSGSYNGALLSLGGEAKVVVEAFLIDKTYEPDDDLQSDVAFESSLAGGKKEFDGSFTETI